MKIPRWTDDYAPEHVAQRLEYAREHSGSALAHVGAFSFEPGTVHGNIENFTGVAQVPLGIAGPLLVDGEHARGEFLVPMATTEGTLVASYNRGMRLAAAAGGVTATVTADRMQRAPAFEFDDARGAREFGGWVERHFAELKRRAEATTRVGRLVEIEQYGVGRLAFLRFDFTTGDAAGQNMVGKATSAACDWILDSYPGIRGFCLESNTATDKKTSRINVLKTRGKRVTAEITLSAELIRTHLHVPAERLFHARKIADIGALISGSNNNGAHSANAIAAIFIATGQDVADVAESSAAIVLADLLPNGDYYYSITLPSLIVGTYGGGTGLATQRESLELMGCYGTGQVGKLAEIIAATVLCGELSLGGAVVAGEWVGAHEALGRNRP